MQVMRIYMKAQAIKESETYVGYENLYESASY